MKTNSQTSDPMYIFEYDETYEHHDSHYETTSDGAFTFLDWYDHKQMLYATAHDNLRLHLLRESYLKIRHYSIYSTSTGIELSESQLILLCSKLFSQYLIIYRC